MKNKIIRYTRCIVFVLLVMVLGIFTEAYSQDSGRDDVLFQVSTIDALLEGVYDGDVTFGELGRHGDFGIGTFNRLDGEMICLDGEFYKIRVDGKVYSVPNEEKTPFAVITDFSADSTLKVNNIEGFKLLEERLNPLISSKNIFYAIRIDGKFEYVKTRSVPGQSEPYQPLASVVKEQALFEFEDVRGTIVGFWCPSYVKGINVPGYHLHFILEDRSSGGHLLECKISDATVKIDDTFSFYMVLPEEKEFLSADLSSNKENALKKVEKE